MMQYNISKISNIQNFMQMDYDDKYITGYALGNWKEAEMLYSSIKY